MPREYKIKWNDSQRKKLNSAVRKYNNAIKKAAKNNPLGAEFLPSLVSYKDLKSGITNRRALKNTVNLLTRATRPDAMAFVRQDDGSIVTRYERNEFKILKSVRERSKSMRAKRMNITQPEAGRLGSITQASLSPDKRNPSSLSAKSLRRFIETQERELNMSSVDKARRYFSNYVASLRTVFGGFSEYDEAISLIEETIIDTAAMDFEKIKQAMDESPSIKFIYDPLSRDAKMSQLLDYWMGVREI